MLAGAIHNYLVLTFFQAHRAARTDDDDGHADDDAGGAAGAGGGDREPHHKKIGMHSTFTKKIGKMRKNHAAKYLMFFHSTYCISQMTADNKRLASGSKREPARFRL